MLIDIIFIIVLPLLFVGVILRIKAIWAGRKGPSLFQPWYNVIKLLHKSEIHSLSTGLMFRIAPSLALVAVFAAALLVPFGSRISVFGFQGDFFLFMSLMALSKAVMVIAAMETASSFEGMGASREISFTAFLEPAFLLITGSLAYAGGLSSMGQLFYAHTIYIYDHWSIIIAILTALALFIMLLVEGARIPFDDPATHLELTMIHEVMVLDTSGINLALVHYTAALKMCIYAALISNFLIPGQGLGIWVPLVFLASMLSLATITGLVESLLPRYRISRNLELVIIPLSVALLVLTALIVNNLGGI
jgi:formate hydrogenlyase subunit 4